MTSLLQVVAFTLASTSCCLATGTSAETRLCDAADGKGENGVALFQGLLKVTHSHDSSSKDGEDEGTSVTAECSKEPVCAIDKCPETSMDDKWKKSWERAAKQYDSEHKQFWKSEEPDRCMEKYKVPKPARLVGSSDMYVLCYYSRAECSNCSCETSMEAKGTAASDPKVPVESGEEIYQEIINKNEKDLEHWMHKDVSGISVWSSTTTVQELGVFMVVDHILSKGGKKGTLISGTHGTTNGNTGFEQEGIQEANFSKDDLERVKNRGYTDTLKILSVSGFMAAAKASGSSGNMDDSMATNIFKSIAGNEDFEPDFIVKAFCFSSTAGETVDEGIRQYAETQKGKASASATSARPAPSPLPKVTFARPAPSPLPKSVTSARRAPSPLPKSILKK